MLQRAEAPKIYGLGEAQFLSGDFDVAQEIAPTQRIAFASREHQIVRLSARAGVPSSNQGALHQPTLVEWHFAFACVGFHIVEFAFVNPIFDGDAVCLEVTPTQVNASF
jgi:hypothetical protein